MKEDRFIPLIVVSLYAIGGLLLVYTASDDDEPSTSWSPVTMQPYHGLSAPQQTAPVVVHEHGGHDWSDTVRDIAIINALQGSSQRHDTVHHVYHPAPPPAAHAQPALLHHAPSTAPAPKYVAPAPAPSAPKYTPAPSRVSAVKTPSSSAIRTSSSSFRSSGSRR